MQETKDTWKNVTLIENAHLYLRVFIRLIASLVAIYVGGWLMLVQPVIGIYHAVCAGTLKAAFLIRSLIKILFSTTVFGAIWCAGYIAAGYFRTYDE